ncbi:MAG: universal stress protein [Limisphaerales bacterium]
MKTSAFETESPATRVIIPSKNRRQLPTGVRLRRRSGIRLKSILVPIDFSAPSMTALDEAVLVANRFGAKITLVHVVATAERKGQQFRLAFRRVGDEQKARLLRLAQEKGIATDLLKDSAVLQGHPFHQITEFARSMENDLIVISTHGYTGFKWFMLGSTTERVVRYAPCPVLVVRNHLRERAPLRLRNILVPVDFPECSTKSLKYAGAFAREFDATETLLHVVYPVYYFSSADFDTVAYGQLLDEMEAIGEAKLLRLFKEQQEAGLNVRKVMRRGHPPMEIVEEARAGKSDLIVIATHGWTGFKRARLGSVAENVVRLAPCDVLVVRRLEHEFV